MKGKNVKERLTYAARIYREGEFYIAEFPQLHVVTHGADFNEALDMAADALETYFFDYLNDRSSPPESNLDIEREKGDVLAIISVQVTPLSGYDMSTAEAATALKVNKQRVAQLRDAGRIRAKKHGRDYLHNTADVRTLASAPRRAGRPRKKLVATA